MTQKTLPPGPMNPSTLTKLRLFVMVIITKGGCGKSTIAEISNLLTYKKK